MKLTKQEVTMKKMMMMEVTYTADNHPIGLLSPSILKK